MAQQAEQRLFDFGQAIERDQQLDLVAHRVLRIGQRLAPRDRRGERLVAGAGLQRDLGRALEQLLVLGPARRVEHQLVRGASLAFAQLDLAEQQLIEERRIEVRVLDLVCLGLGAWRGSARAGKHQQRQGQGRSADRG